MADWVVHAPQRIGFPQARGSAASGAMVDSEGVLGAGGGTLCASATSGSIALLARPADHDEEELP
ncbi:hypothetical protein [Micromonospora sp. NPDC023644]|uniref:hypothetical protein n=1 Tax=Micromonospora sp. NPDC023644 TaxID=3154321 RepID=UPI003403ECC9